MTRGLGAGLVALGLLAGCGGAPSPARDAAPPWPAAVEDLGWLVGDWVGRGPAETCFVERWFPPSGGSLMGVGRHERDGVVRVRETMRILRDAGGALSLIVMLDDGRVSRFALARHGQTAFTARRQGPGWPGAIAYRLAADGGLELTLGADDERQVELVLSRVPAHEARCVDEVPGEGT